MVGVVLSMSLIAIIAAGLIGAPPLSADDSAVTVRSWQHPDFGRLVIEWAGPMQVRQKLAGDRLMLRFTAPLVADIRPAINRLDTYLDGGRTFIEGSDLTLGLRPAISPRLQIYEGRIIVVDFRGQGPGGSLKASADLQIEVSTIENGVRLLLLSPAAIRFEARQSPGNLEIGLSPTRRIDPADLAMLNDEMRPWLRAVRETAGDGSKLVFDLQPMTVPSVRPDGDRSLVIDLVRDASRASPRQQAIFIPARRPRASMTQVGDASGAMPPIPQPRPVAHPAADEADGAPVLAASSADRSDVAETQSSPEQIAAAAFTRAGYLWLVLDAPAEAPPEALLPPTSPPVGPGERVDADGGIAFRFPLQGEIGLQVAPDQEGRWRISVDEEPSSLTSIAITRTGTPPALHAAAPAGGRLVRLIDPAVGDAIEIWPLREPGVGNREGRRFVDLVLLPTLQGLAWRPLSDRLAASVATDGLELSSEHGLVLSTLSEAEMSPQRSAGEPSSASVPAPNFDGTTGSKPAAEQAASATDDAARSDHASGDTGGRPEESMTSSFDLADLAFDRALVAETRRVLRQAISEAPSNRRDQARLDLARLLVAERLASEARIVLGTISENAAEPIAASRRALRGVSAFLTGHVTEATSLLLASEFDADAEVDIWRAAIDSVRKDWQRAAERWTLADATLDRYPPRLRFDLGLMAVEAAIKTDDDPMIQKGLQRLRSLELSPYEAARIERMEALRAERDGDIDRARAILMSLAEGRYQDLSILAGFELATLGTGDGKETGAALADLDRQMPVWRGHPEEAEMLDALARRYRDAGELRKALSVWQRLIRSHPEMEHDPEILDARRATFVDAVATGDDPKARALGAYSIYLDFIDLLPNGPEARPINRVLAHHLADLDLVAEALQVLRPLIDTAPGDLERAELGADMADLFLRQDRAEPALSILDRTEGRGAALQRSLEERRRLSRARALAKLGRDDEALRLLQDVNTGSARRLRAKILWDRRDWPGVARAVESFLTDAKRSSPIAAEDQKLILWLALARAQQGRPDLLRALRGRFARDMQAGPWADAFMVATQTGGEAVDVKSVLADAEDDLAELRRFRESVTAGP